VTLACSSSPQKAPTDGGDVPFTCPNPAEMTDDNTISDFEDGFDRILQLGNRNGGWYAYNSVGDPDFMADTATTCLETPPANRCATDAPKAAMIPDGGRCTSVYALRFYGSGCSGYAGFGTDLAAAQYPDGGDPTAAICGDGGVPPVAHKTPYDLSSYKAISFWGRTGDMAVPKSQQVQFKLPMLADTKITDGGDCNPDAIKPAKCSASYGAFMVFSATWKEFTINLDPSDKVHGIAQESWGKVFTWDPTQVTSIQYQAKGGATYDIYIDDIRLIPKS